jgi:putative ABC transport system ATP-binding protein
MLPLLYQRIPENKRKKLAIEALEKVWLWNKIYNNPNELSWGQQQRVSIARALAVNPWFILADEPTWALDSRTWDEIMNLLQELNREWKTIILITHEKEIDDYASKHILIKDWLIV